MLRAERKPKALPGCAVCGLPAEWGFWGQHLCGACFSRWREAPSNLDALELAHADQHPEDVERRGEYAAVPVGCTDRRWVLLKGSISMQLAKSAAAAWMLEQRTKSARGAA